MNKRPGIMPMKRNRKSAKQDLRTSGRASANSWPSGEMTPCTSIFWELPSCKAALQEKGRDSLDNKLNMSQ